MEAKRAMLIQDLRYARRMLRKNPAFTVTAVLSLALGVGANTAIFSLIDALLLRTLPVRDPQQLVQVTLTIAGVRADSFSYPAVRALQQQMDVLSALAGFSPAVFNAGVRGETERTRGAWVTGGFYQTMQLEPVIGRLLTPDDDRPGGGTAGPVAVITDGYWERMFRRDQGAIGQRLLIEGSPVTIVGVSPPGFSGADVGQIADITIPLGTLAPITPERANRLEAGSQWLRVLARPKPGVSAAQVRARLAVLWPAIAKSLLRPQMPPERRKAELASVVDIVPGGTGWSSLRRQFTQPLLVLMAVVALVLLIACANVANLLLARATARQKEIAIRLAIGAGRGRLIRQLLTESMLLSVLGSALGVVFAYAGSRLLLELLSSGRIDSIVLDLHPDLRVLAFTSAVALASGILFGLAPAFRATALRPGSALKENTRGQRVGRGRLGQALVISQVALSLLLLIGAGQFVRSLENLRNVDAGFHHEGVLLIDLDPRRAGYKEARLASLYQEMLARMTALPGVRSASLSEFTPLSGGIWSDRVLVEGQASGTAHFNSIAPGYFDTIRTPLLLGRDFTLRDDSAAPTAAIVNEAFVRQFLHSGNPLGRHVSTAGALKQNLEIVGVVKDAVSFSLRNPAPPAVYLSCFQRPMGGATLEVLASGALAQVSTAVRQAIHDRLPDAPLVVQTFSAQVDRSLIQERLMATLASFFGVLALGLAAVGLYGVMSYGVTRRTGEIGIRMAVGARAGDVLWLVLRGTFGLVGVGVMLGLPAAWAASRLVATMLFGLSPTDPVTVAFATAVLVLVAALAAYLPARRASRVDPVVALRE